LFNSLPTRSDRGEGLAHELADAHELLDRIILVNVCRDPEKRGITTDKESQSWIDMIEKSGLGDGGFHFGESFSSGVGPEERTDMRNLVKRGEKQSQVANIASELSYHAEKAAKIGRRGRGRIEANRIAAGRIKFVTQRSI
jgi:hypothetical protein